MSYGLLTITLIIAAVTLSVTAVFLIRKAYFKKYQNRLFKLERSKNEIAGMPILPELNKIEAILKNEKLEAKYNEWYSTYNQIKNKQLVAVTDMLVDADYFINKKDYNNLIFKLAKIEMELYKIRTRAEITLKKIKEVTLSEEKYRNLMITFKSKYRHLVNVYNKSKLDYYDVGKSIELQFENVEKRFKKFTKAMDKNDYDEVAAICKSVNEMLDHLAIIIEETPRINGLARNFIPKKINELNAIYMRMIKDNYNLDFLKFNYNITEIEKRLNDILDRAKLLNTVDSLLELETISNYLDELYSRLDQEKEVRGVFEESMRIFDAKHNSLKELIKNIYIALEEIKYNYDIEPGDADLIEKFNNELEAIYKEYEKIASMAKEKKESFTKLDHMIEIVFKKLHVLDAHLNDIFKSLSGMKDDEARAVEQLEEIKYLFRQCKVKLRAFKLPVIKQIYHTETREAFDSIEEINKVLNTRPIRIDVLNTRVNTAMDLVFKLHNNTKELIKAAALAEMAIVYGNRYRYQSADLSEALDYSERLFAMGNYAESLETTINTTVKFQPKIYDILIKNYQES